MTYRPALSMLPSLADPLRDAAAARSPRPAKGGLARRLPWNDRAGRFAPLKAATLILVSLPALNLARVALTVGVAPRPFKVPIVVSGEWGVWLLLLTLAVTPARRLFNLPRLIAIRRILGVSALAYTLLHLALYFADTGYSLSFAASEIALRLYLTVGFAATLGLLLLGATSTDAMIRRMGTPAWRRLHRTVLVIAVAALCHYLLATPAAAVMDCGGFLWLAGYRLMAALKWKPRVAALLVLALTAAIATALFEAAWFETVRPGIGARLVAGDLTPWIVVRPPWRILGYGVAIAVAAMAWRRVQPWARPVRRLVSTHTAAMVPKLAPRAAAAKAPP
jgi:sulfoxide reductase heme-binding subunit YedZ